MTERRGLDFDLLRAEMAAALDEMTFTEDQSAVQAAMRFVAIEEADAALMDFAQKASDMLAGPQPVTARASAELREVVKLLLTTEVPMTSAQRTEFVYGDGGLPVGAETPELAEVLAAVVIGAVIALGFRVTMAMPPEERVAYWYELLSVGLVLWAVQKLRRDD